MGRAVLVLFSVVCTVFSLKKVVASLTVGSVSIWILFERKYLRWPRSIHLITILTVKSLFRKLRCMFYEWGGDEGRILLPRSTFSPYHCIWAKICLTTFLLFGTIQGEPRAVSSTFCELKISRSSSTQHGSDWVWPALLSHCPSHYLLLTSLPLSFSLPFPCLR